MREMVPGKADVRLDQRPWSASGPPASSERNRLTAAPVPARLPRDEAELIRPAADGTLRVLHAGPAG